MQLESIVAPVVEGLGFVFWGIELQGRGKDALLRIYIDAEAGVGINDCALVSRQVSALLDVEDPIEKAYVLEVSSPGWDRPLFKETHFKAFLGSVVEIKLLALFEGKRKFKGILSTLEDGEIAILVDDEEFTFPLELVDKAKIVPQY